MTQSELAAALEEVAGLVHRIYHDSNEGPRLLNELMRDYPETRGRRPDDEEE